MPATLQSPFGVQCSNLTGRATARVVGIGKVYDTSKNQTRNVAFFLENVLSPKGRCVAYPVVVKLFLLNVLIFGLGKEYDTFTIKLLR